MQSSQSATTRISTRESPCPFCAFGPNRKIAQKRRTEYGQITLDTPRPLHEIGASPVSGSALNSLNVNVNPLVLVAIAHRYHKQLFGRAIRLCHKSEPRGATKGRAVWTLRLYCGSEPKHTALASWCPASATGSRSREPIVVHRQLPSMGRAMRYIITIADDGATFRPGTTY